MLQPFSSKFKFAGEAMLSSPDTEGEVVGVEKHEVEESLLFKLSISPTIKATKS